MKMSTLHGMICHRNKERAKQLARVTNDQHKRDATFEDVLGGKVSQNERCYCLSDLLFLAERTNPGDSIKTV